MIYGPYKAYGVEVLAVGGSASVQDAFNWKMVNDLSFEVLSDPTSAVFYQYVPILIGAPWTSIVGTNHVLAMSENSYVVPGDSLNMPVIIGVLNSLFAPQPSATPNPLAFGQVPVGQYADSTIVLRNAGTGVLVLQNATSSDPVFTISPTQDSIFAVGDSAIITVRFQPTQAGLVNATLTFVTTTGNLEVPVSGDGAMGVAPDPSLPLGFSLNAFPNPFNPELNVTLELPRAQDVAVELYTVNGMRLAGLHQGRMESGTHRLNWAAGSSPSGLYLLKITGNGWQEIRKVALVR